MRHIFQSITLSLCALALAGCMASTTSAGAVDANRSQIMLVSAEEMEQSANESYAQIIAEAKAARTLNRDAATYNRVQAIAKRLIAETPAFRQDAPGWDWQVNVISEDTINAWCMPGGKIVVYTGIIEHLNLTDAQLAAVMGHEIAHALREHSREQASSNAMTNMGLSAVSAIFDLGELGQSALGLAAQYTLALPFSRKHETEADHVGTELMARAGYDPNEAVNIWKKMSELTQSSTPEIMSTHPSNESRIKDLEQIVTKVYPLYQAAKK